MDGFEINRILAALFLALLVGMLSSKLADFLVSPSMLTKAAFPIEVVEEAGTVVDSAGEGTKDEPIEPLLVKANVEHGQEVAKKCLQCHTFEKGGINKVGPNLWNILGNKVAHLDNYSYSAVFKSHGGTWTYQEMSHYLLNPQKHIPGTKMAFPGLKKPQDRADVIAYLRTLSDSPIALPKS